MIFLPEVKLLTYSRHVYKRLPLYKHFWKKRVFNLSTLLEHLINQIRSEALLKQTVSRSDFSTEYFLTGNFYPADIQAVARPRHI